MDIQEKGLLKFQVENLGSIESGGFIQRPLTIFCGPNNSGKTWAMYSLYNFHRMVDIEQKYKGKRKTSIKKFNSEMSNSLDDLFNTQLASISNARFTVKNNEAQFDALLRNSKYNTFLIPAERNGLHLFFRELSTRRNALLHHASKKNINILELLADVIRSRYATPIARYINWLNDLGEMKKDKSDFHDYAQQVQKDLADGIYRVDSKTGDIEFKPKKQSGINTQYMGLHLTSSAVKSLFGLWFYLEHRAKKGDILMIDEPELNIHPENQIKITRLLAQLVNAGLKVVISTHSDYMIREFNSLIMLSQDKTLQEKHEYTANETLETEQIGAYLFENNTIEVFEITPDDGIYASTFDKVIENLNRVNNDIYYSLQEKINDE